MATRDWAKWKETLDQHDLNLRGHVRNAYFCESAESIKREQEERLIANQPGDKFVAECLQELLDTINE